jgi:S1-C subfamily serine protease
MYTFGVIDGDRVTQMQQGLPQHKGSVQGPVTSNKDAALPTTTGDGSIGVSSDENPAVRHDGVTISRVTAGGPANQVGIQAGDTILAIDDHYLFTVQELNQEIRRRKPGTRIAIRYRRYSTIYDAHVIVGHAE